MKKNIRFITYLSGILLLYCSNTIAQPFSDSLSANRYITRATLFGMGYTNVFDTYLSPQEYKGVDFRILNETMRMTNLCGGRVSIQSLFQADIGYTHNRTNNNNTFSGLVNWNYGLHYQFRLTNNFKLLAGALGDINAGFVYNLRNTNNPASARGYINLDASVMAIWHLRIKRYPIVLRYQANLPVMGVMFSPEKGQSYYEIFTLGNSSKVIQFTSLHNQPSLRQMLSVDLPIRYAKMRVSYVADLQQSHVNDIKTHTYSHVFMMGFVKDMYLVRNKKGTPLPAAVRAY